MHEIFIAFECFFTTHRSLFLIIGIASAALFACTLALTPLVILHLPETYFFRPKAKPTRRSFLLRLFLLIVRNGAGVFLIALGLVLLILPGPGWLTIFAGVALIDFPFKHRLEMKILTLPPVRRAVNGLREKHGKKPLLFPERRPPS